MLADPGGRVVDEVEDSTTAAAAVVVEGVEQILDDVLVRARQTARDRRGISAEQAVRTRLQFADREDAVVRRARAPEGARDVGHGDQRRRAHR